MAIPETKLQLVQRLCREAEAHSSGPISTQNQRGLFLKLVDDIDAAYSEIQSVHPTWEFLRKSFSHTLTIGKANYLPTELGITDHKKWREKEINLYKELADEFPLIYITRKDWDQSYGMGSNTTTTNRPHSFTINPDGSITLYPIPDYAYTIKGDYQRAPHAMLDDDDVPLFEVDYRLSIVWKALETFGVRSGEPGYASYGAKEYMKIFRMLEKRYLPRIRHGRPLA
jgi:hypothetical protein